MKRIIIHWTGGSWKASSLDKEHYHYLIEGSNGNVVKGHYPVSANESTSDLDGYAAHTRFLNTGSIGVSICAMAGATKSPFMLGNYPITTDQWNSLFSLCAELCVRYSIPVTRKTVLTHAEVEPTLDIPQRGKWDIAVFPYKSRLGDPVTVGDEIRRKVKFFGVDNDEIKREQQRQEPDYSKDCANILLKNPYYGKSGSDSVSDCTDLLLEMLREYYNVSTLDQIKSPDAIAALVKTFQIKENLLVDGITGPETWGRLVELVGGDEDD